jgi:hypothetical protein
MAGVAVKDNVYLSDKIEVEFQPTDRSRAELAAQLLKLTGVGAEVRREGGRDVWYVIATTNKLAVGREELRKALAEFFRAALRNKKKAEHWLEKLERGRVLKEGWPEYLMKLVKGALVVRFGSTSPESIKREAQRLREIGLEEGVHFTVKMPEGNKKGYVNILRRAWRTPPGSPYAARKSNGGW